MLVELMTFQEFCDLGAEGDDRQIRDPKTGLYLLPNGSSCAADRVGGAVYHQAPVAKSARLRNISRYWRCRLDQATARLDSTKAAFIQAAHWCAMGTAAGPPENAEEILKALAQDVLRFRDRWNAVEQERQSMSDVMGKRLLLEQEAERKAQMAELTGKLQSISPASMAQERNGEAH